MTIERFVNINISGINDKISNFKATEYTDLQIKKYLKNKLIRDVENPDFKSKLFEKMEKCDYKKSSLKEIADDFVLYKPDLEKYISNQIFSSLSLSYISEDDDFTKDIINVVRTKYFKNDKEYKFIESKLKNIVSKMFHIIFRNGFTNNVTNVESGVMTANAGDSAQFLFVSRAILAGYNCSNVDVRSSRYDSVIDIDGKILKVQVKGISGSSIALKDRDRGGQGIDHHHERNKGKRITSADCDIYAAVDKQVGLIYLLPMKHFDDFHDEEVFKLHLKDLNKYLENWDVVDNIDSYI